MAEKSVSVESPAASQPNNPLSKKLNKILETRLENDKVRSDMTLYQNANINR